MKRASPNHVHLLDVTAKVSKHTYLLSEVSTLTHWYPDARRFFSIEKNRGKAGVSTYDTNSFARQWIALPDQSAVALASPLSSFEFSPDGMRLALSTPKEGIQIWDLSTQKWVGTYNTGHPSPNCCSLDWSPTGQILATSDETSAEIHLFQM